MTAAALLFSARGAGGLAVLLAGIWGWRQRPNARAARALLAVCAPAAVALITGVDVPAPGWFALLHTLAVAMVPAGLFHLALTFPVDRLRGRRTAAQLLLYLPSLVLALAFRLVAADPQASAALRTAAFGAATAGALAVAAVLLTAVLRAPAADVRRRSALALLGGLGAAIPAAVQLLRLGAGAGAAIVETAAMTAFLFPLAVGTAIAIPGLIEIDDLLRRVLSGALLAATVGATYVGTWLAIGALYPAGGFAPAVPAAALVNLLIVFLVVPLRDTARSLSDRLLAPAAYDSEVHLAALSRGLASARTVETVVSHARGVLGQSLRPSWAMVYVPDGEGRFRPAGGAGRRAVTVPPALMVPIGRGDPVLLDRAKELREALPPPWDTLDTALLMPLRANRETVGLLALGRRASRRPYTPHDLAFLRTAAYQVALALLSSAAFDQLDALNQRLSEGNARLEEQVAERTAALEAKNADLQRSLTDLQRTCRQLEEHHTGLLRAERLATLGRLTAGFAHEINTPLGAVLNALKILADLAREYAAGIDDAEVQASDHHEIAREMLATTQSATEWVRKAASYVRGVQSHGRDAHGAGAPFVVREVVDEVRGLVAHRLRTVGCRVEFAEEPPGLTLVGDRSQLGQILVNLITNAVDAYEERGIADGQITVHAMRTATGGMRLRVTDGAGGISPAILPHIFEELYTTKGVGRGTGLGLWIARALVEQGFGGTLDVLTSHGSSTFVADFPTAACVERTWGAGPAAAASPMSVQEGPGLAMPAPNGTAVVALRAR